MPGLQAHRWSLELIEHPRLSLCIAHDERGRLACVSFGGAPARHRVETQAASAGATLEAHAGPPSEAKRQLRAYLQGDLRHFDLELAPRGTAFELEAWAALREIPFGETRSYKDQALAMGRDAASARAIGRANGANPIAIVIPCHRVIGASGKLVGFAGGVETKAWLLSHERGQGSLFDAADTAGASAIGTEARA